MSDSNKEPLTTKQAREKDATIPPAVLAELLTVLAGLVSSLEPGQHLEVQSETSGKWHPVKGTSLNVNRKYRVADPFAEVRAAIKAGKTIEYRTYGQPLWKPVQTMHWLNTCEYRVKPEDLTLHVYECLYYDKKSTALIHSQDAPESKPETVREFINPARVPSAKWRVKRWLYSIKTAL